MNLSDCVRRWYEFVVIFIHQRLHVRVEGLSISYDLRFMIHNLFQVEFLDVKKEKKINKRKNIKNQLQSRFWQFNKSFFTFNILCKYTSLLKCWPLISYGLVELSVIFLRILTIHVETFRSLSFELLLRTFSCQRGYLERDATAGYSVASNPSNCSIRNQNNCQHNL